MGAPRRRPSRRGGDQPRRMRRRQQQHGGSSAGAAAPAATPVKGGTLTFLRPREQFDHIDPQRVYTGEDLAFFGGDDLSAP